MSTDRSSRYKTPVYKKDQPDDSYKFKPLPGPVGVYPFHLDIKSIIPDIHSEKIIFHMVGDTGSLRNPEFTRLVANAMALQCAESENQPPQFLYHLGDVVYNHGEVTEYDRQFFIPYQQYPGPIFAIPGNHDSDVNPAAVQPYKSLEPFVKVFCSPVQQPVDFSLIKDRPSMTQPNIYWTMETPLATIIGLYTNVPKYGIVTKEQRTWFAEELVTAGKQQPDKMLIVCMHHSPYSADINHSSSIAMIEFLEETFFQTGVRPDAVFSGHVHSYQRFLKTYPDGFTTTYIVAGAGGYDELHPVATLDNPQFSGDHPLFKNVVLVNYCDNKHGFLKLVIERKEHGPQLTGEYFSIAHEYTTAKAVDAQVVERFSVTPGKKLTHK
ncbi:metallophosphoesterase [Ferruginibacter sp.]|uniref:metallophosphoesterase family protein n=1 Tax=Ferruginibacter sp. TaxID=1940288 RepID=UPI00265875AC|nr:metallophosphoesterase [Ferruginibacter sp.]